jgi:hypothetical protein
MKKSKKGIVQFGFEFYILNFKLKNYGTSGSI